VRRAGFRAVCVGEAADDLFGGFKFALRFYRGAALRKYYQRQLEIDLPDELAILQNLFRPWGISVVDPFWTRELLEVGYNLPLRYRLDARRLMKMVLRHAFAEALPAQIVERPKCVTRDATQIRDVLEQAFGRSRERYRPYLRFDQGDQQP
jgi:asparagine synthetase B (glutamine-hydrolysing)